MNPLTLALRNLKSQIVIIAAVAALATSPPAPAQTPVAPKWSNFTNSQTSYTSFAPTNSLIMVTQGYWGVSSAPVKIFRGRGLGLGVSLATTNSLLTNFVMELQGSPDGTNWDSAPIPVIFGPIAATGRFNAHTNLTADFMDNIQYIRVQGIRATNVANTVGNIFFTNTTANREPTIWWSIFP